VSLTFSKSAARQIKGQIAKRGKGIGLRVGVRKVGCSGFAYTFDYAEEARADDQTFEAHDALLVVATDDMSFLAGSHLDYVKEGLKEMFKLDNPNIDATCGCGESFNLKAAVAATT